MRVIFDVIRDGLQSVNQAAREFQDANRQVASGRRLSAPSDDPLGARQAVNEHATLGRIDAYTRAGDAAGARLAVVDTMLAGYVDKITAAVVAGQSARGSHATPTSRAAAAAEVRSLRDSMATDLNVSFNGVYLFSGTESGTPAYASSLSGWTYQGNADTNRVDVGINRSVAVTFDGQALAQGGAATDVFTVLDDLADAIDAGNNAAIGVGLADLEAAFDRALVFQGRLGADERGLDDAATSLTTMRLASDSRRAAIEDADLAEAATRMSQAELAYKSALSAVSAVERQSLLDYLR